MTTIILLLILYAYSLSLNFIEKFIIVLNLIIIFKGTWETTVKKKKNRQTSASKTETTEATPGDEWNETTTHTEEKPKPRSKTGGPQRLHGRNNDSRGCMLSLILLLRR